MLFYRYFFIIVSNISVPKNSVIWYCTAHTTGFDLSSTGNNLCAVGHHTVVLKGCCISQRFHPRCIEWCFFLDVSVVFYFFGHSPPTFFCLFFFIDCFLSSSVFSQVKKTVSKLCSRLGKKKKKGPKDKDIVVLFIFWLQIVWLVKRRYNEWRTRGRNPRVSPFGTRLKLIAVPEGDVC